MQELAHQMINNKEFRIRNSSSGSASEPGCRQCNQHWTEELEAGPQGRHWALECQPAGWHWIALGHWSASLRLALAGNGHWSANQILLDAHFFYFLTRKITLECLK